MSAPVLASAARRMWTGWRVIVPTVAINAGLQALLVWPQAVPGQGWQPVLLAALSALVFIVTLRVLVTQAMIVVARTPRVDRRSQRAVRWLLLVLAVLIGTVLAVVLGGLTAFFWRGAVAALLVWLVCGFLVAWVTTAVLLLRRDTRAAPKVTRAPLLQ